MAPRRGSSSSRPGLFSSSGSSCYFCHVQYALFGYDWHNSTITALFVFQIFCALALLAAIILTFFFHWIRPTGRPASARTGIFNIAAFFMLLYFLLRLIDTGLTEENTSVTYLYNILYIFLALFWRIGEVLLLGVVFRTVQVQHALSNPASPPVVAKVLKPVSIVVLVIEALLALASFALTTAALAYRMIDGRFSPQELKREHDEARVETPYQVIYFVASLLLLVCTLLLFGPKHRHLSSTAKLLLVITTGCLVFRELFNFINQAVYAYSDDNNSTIRNFGWASEYIYVFMNIAIFLALALFACQRPGGEAVERQSVVPNKGLGYGAAAAPGVPVAGYGQVAPMGHPQPAMAMNNPPGAGWKGKYWYGYQNAPSGPQTYA